MGRIATKSRGLDKAFTEAPTAGMSEEPLRRLVYRSRAHDGLGMEALLALLVNARERNATSGITGLLVHEQGRFLQVIEGPPEAIEGLWQAIQRDRRHRDVELLGDRVCQSRWFGDWSMELADADRLPGRYAGVWTTALPLPVAAVRDANDAERLVRPFADTGSG